MTIIEFGNQVEFFDFFRNQELVLRDHQCECFFASLFDQTDDLEIVVIAKIQGSSPLSPLNVENDDAGSDGCVQAVDSTLHRDFH